MRKIIRKIIDWAYGTDILMDSVIMKERANNQSIIIRDMVSRYEAIIDGLRKELYDLESKLGQYELRESIRRTLALAGDDSYPSAPERPDNTVGVPVGDKQPDLTGDVRPNHRRKE